MPSSGGERMDDEDAGGSSPVPRPTASNATASQAVTLTPIPTGADIYKYFVPIKRKRSPRGPTTGGPIASGSGYNPVVTNNRFSALSDTTRDATSGGEPSAPVAHEKPPPMYIRGITHIGRLLSLMRELKIENFDIKILKKGLEAKLQLISV